MVLGLLLRRNVLETVLLICCVPVLCLSADSDCVRFWPVESHYFDRPAEPKALCTVIKYLTWKVWQQLLIFPLFFRNVLQTSVSFLNDWNLITTILTGQGNTPVGMWHWSELGSINLDPKQDLGRKLYFFFQCLLRADLNGSIWSHFIYLMKEEVYFRNLLMKGKEKCIQLSAQFT